MQRTRQGRLSMRLSKLLRRKSARDFLRSRRNPLRPRTNSTRRSRSAGRKLSAMRDVSSRRKKASTRKRMPSRRGNPVLPGVKKSSQNRVQ